MIINEGKFFKVALESVKAYDELYHDLTWYLYKLTNVSRIVCKESMREFLLRYMLIIDQPVEKTASQFIDHGILISGSIGGKPFEFSTSDFINFLGYSSNSSKYHIFDDLDTFINKYKRLDYKIDIEKTGDKEYKITQDVLVNFFLDTKTLYEIDSLDLVFKEDLKSLTEEEYQQALHFVDYVMSTFPSEKFEEYRTQFSDFLNSSHLYYIEQEKIEFDPFEELPREVLASIYEKMLGEDDFYAFALRSDEELDEDYLEDIKYYAKYIRFAYGVKHGLIQVNDDWYGAYNHYDPRFVDNPIEEYQGPDCEMYSTRYIYESWDMDEWIDLVP